MKDHGNERGWVRLDDGVRQRFPSMAEQTMMNASLAVVQLATSRGAAGPTRPGPGPIYPRMLRERFGYAAEVDALLAANADRDEPVLPDTARRLAEDVLLVATHDELGDTTASWTQAGADRLDLVRPFGLDDAELLTAAQAVFPGPVARDASSQRLR